MNENAWRAVMAALADDRARDVYARIVLGQPVEDTLDAVPARKAQRIVDTLIGAGLVARTPQGYDAVADVFTRAMAAAGRPARAEGVHRFLKDGRLVSYPSRADDRRALLVYLASRVLDAGETIAEKDINQRLSEVTDDTARVRRALVDEGLITRTPSGSQYSLAAR